MTYIIYNPLSANHNNSRFKSVSLLETNIRSEVFFYEHQYLLMFGLKLFFQPLEVVDRGSETQPQVVENLNKFTSQNKG